MPGKTATAAWEHGKALILAFPSSSGPGYYLCRVEARENTIIVIHSCPAANRGKACWHIKQAAEHFREWRWWNGLELKETVTVTRTVIFTEEAWKKIPVPMSIEGVA